MGMRSSKLSQAMTPLTPDSFDSLPQSDSLTFLDGDETEEGGFTPFREKNMGEMDRWISGVLGGALVAYGMSRKSLKGAFLSFVGGGLVLRGLRGYSRLYQKLQINTTEFEKEEEGLLLEDTVVIDAPISSVYSFIRQPQHLPMLWSPSFELLSTEESKVFWQIRDSQDEPLILDAEIVADVKDRLVSWRSLPYSLVSHEGSIYLRSLPSNKTELKIFLKHDPPAGQQFIDPAGILPIDNMKSNIGLLQKQIEQTSSEDS